MGQDLAAVEQLVKIRAAHAEAFGGLTWRDRLIIIDDDEFVACTNAAAQAQQQVTQFGTSIRACELVVPWNRSHTELWFGDLGGIR